MMTKFDILLPKKKLFCFDRSHFLDNLSEQKVFRHRNLISRDSYYTYLCIYVVYLCIYVYAVCSLRTMIIGNSAVVANFSSLKWIINMNFTIRIRRWMKRRNQFLSLSLSLSAAFSNFRQLLVIFEAIFARYGNVNKLELTNSCHLKDKTLYKFGNKHCFTMNAFFFISLLLSFPHIFSLVYLHGI